jgi:glycosyltransferase involved in cell wall biosynthesis
MTKQNKPLVSIIMPVYNAGKFLVPALESIRSQTLADYELIIVDDGSTDHSWKTIQRYAKKDTRIHAYQNKTNHGVVFCLNFLIKKTVGTYVARMDADDISLPDRLEKQVTLLTQNPLIVACGGQEEIIDENSTIIADKFFPTDPDICHDLILNVMVIHPGVLMARGTIIRKLRCDNHTHINDDISLHFKLLKYGRFSNVNSIVYQYRQRPKTVTHTHPKWFYFLALEVRLKAILRYGYTPNLINLLLLIPETILVAMLPESWIVPAFSWIRYVKQSKLSAFQYPFLTFRTA